MENVRDWCISRQLWWGHRIPAWYDKDGNFVVAENEEEANKLYSSKFQVSGVKLIQDSDVLDTWASSWLWPMQVFGGFNSRNFRNGKIDRSGNKDLDYFYPTKVLVTAPEILFFWVARMIIAGYEYLDERPFEDVYLTGVVRDKQGRKMSKSLGNSPDALELITKYGADGVRTGMLFSSAAGNDLLFDEKLCEQGRNFTNKIWNAFRLVKGWEIAGHAQPEENKIAIAWFESKFNHTLSELEDHFSKFRMSDALHTLYKLTWDDFCAWYLEIIKPEFGKPIDDITYQKTISFFESILKLLHPFMPFITEELWHELGERKVEDCIIVAPWPTAKTFDPIILLQGEAAFEVVTQIRNVRNAKGISPKESFNVSANKSARRIEYFEPVIKKLANLISLDFDAGKFPTTSTTTTFMVGTDQYTIPLEGKVDAAKEKEEIIKEMEYNQGFLNSVMKKLSNEKFVSGAPPQVIEMERKKKADAEMKIKSLKDRLATLQH
jgi:valyl-tRNA synthetase